MSQLAEIILTVDELETMRLADFEGLYQEVAAKRMNVSRQTFGRILSAARRKVAEALVKGSALRIDGGEFQLPRLRTFACGDCDRNWQLPFGTGRPEACPQCGSTGFSRIDGGGCGGGGRQQASPVVQSITEKDIKRIGSS